MTNRDIALTFTQYFCSGNINEIKSLLDSNLIFKGPFHTFYSAKDYIESLEASPPEKLNCNIISVTENKNEVAIFYKYLKTYLTLDIAQLVKINNQKIIEIKVIFDAAGLV